MVYDTILFDLDDTLHFRRKTIFRFLDSFREKYSDSMDRESSLILKDVFIEIDCGGYKSREQMFRELRDRIGWKTKPEMRELMDFWNLTYPNCAEPMPDLYETLDFLSKKKIKMGIVTNGSSQMQNIKIDRLKLRKYMDSIIISEEVDRIKPDPEIFQLALSSIHSCRDNTLFVGDNPSTDIAGAMHAGLTAVWFKNQMWSIEPYKPKYIINCLSDIKEIF